MLPTNAETIELFEKTLIGGFSCVNTCLAFDINMLMPNSRNNEKITKRKDLKFAYKLKNEKTNSYEDKRIVSKILKMEEKNQYRNPLTKPLLLGVIK